LTTSSFFLTDPAYFAKETAVGDMRAFGETLFVRSVSERGRRVRAHTDTFIRVWEVETSKLNLLVAIPCGGCHIISLEVAGEVILAATTDKTVRIFKLYTRRLLRSMIGHRDTVSSISACPDADYYMTSSWDGALKLWATDADVFALPVTSTVITQFPEAAERKRKAQTAKDYSRALPLIPQVSLYEKRKQEMERKKRREKAEEEAIQSTKIAKDLRAISSLVWDIS
jgi:WD40 repeat protein